MIPLVRDTPLIIAHRGYSGRYPENTIIAFLAALQNKADGIELDIVPSHDNQYMVIHDECLDRTTNGEGWVQNFNANELQKLDAGSWFAPHFNKSYIPTLNEVFEFLGNKLLINVEIKGGTIKGRERKERLETGLLKIINRYRVSRSVIVSSFDHDCALHLKSIPFGLLYDSLPNPTEVLDAVQEYKACSVHPGIRELTASWMREVTAHNIPILPWTINDPTIAEQLIDWGACGIFTDQPVKIRQALRNTTSKTSKKPKPAGTSKSRIKTKKKAGQD